MLEVSNRTNYTIIDSFFGLSLNYFQEKKECTHSGGPAGVAGLKLARKVNESASVFNGGVLGGPEDAAGRQGARSLPAPGFRFVCKKQTTWLFSTHSPQRSRAWECEAPSQPRKAGAARAVGLF